jgi:hypothetical protein
MTVTPLEFLNRWFQHVPPRGLRTIGRSRLSANYCGKVRQSICAQLEPESSSRAASEPRVASDDLHQKVLSLNDNLVPGDYKIVEDKDRPGRFLHSRITNPKSTELEFRLNTLFHEQLSTLRSIERRFCLFQR